MRLRISREDKRAREGGSGPQRRRETRDRTLRVGKAEARAEKREWVEKSRGRGGKAASPPEMWSWVTLPW